MNIRGDFMKKIFFVLDDEGYIEGGISYGDLDGSNVKTKDVEDGHPVLNNDPSTFKLVDDELIFDEKRRQKLIAEQEKEQSKIPKEERNEMAILELAMVISEMKGGK